MLKGKADGLTYVGSEVDVGFIPDVFLYRRDIGCPKLGFIVAVHHHHRTISIVVGSGGSIQGPEGEPGFSGVFGKIKARHL